MPDFGLVPVHLTTRCDTPTFFASLPTAAASEQEQKAPPVHLAIDAHGVITWDSEVVTPTEITDRLLALPVTPDTKVLIAADSACPHGQVVPALDAAKAAKVEKVAFETKTPAP